MSKAIKLAAIISALAIIITSFSACSITLDGNDTSTEPTTVSDVYEKEATNEVSDTTEATQAPTAAEKQEKIEDIFAEIKSFKLGTVGSSQSAAELALRIIAFSASSLAKADTLKDDVQALVATIDADKLDYYGETLYQINIYAEKFFNGDVAEVVDLSGIGNDFDSEKSYSKTDYDKIYKLLSDY